MDYKANNSYFDLTSRLLSYIYVPLLAAGAIFIILNFALDNMFFLSMGIMLFLGGFVIAVFDSGRRTKDSEIKRSVREEVAKMPDKMERKMEEMKKHPREISKYSFYSYDFSSTEGVKAKRGNDKTVRSSRVSYTSILFATENREQRLLIYRNIFSIIDNTYTETLDDIYYEDLQEVSIEEKSTSFLLSGEKEPTKIIFTVMHIKTKSGIDISFPVKNDATTDGIVQDINRMIARKAENNEL
ncbi:MAG: hypothetical protein GX827_02165 [Clostridiales bacterium]|nr:hypothetical protein [Clostridiales bacterium]